MHFYVIAKITILFLQVCVRKTETLGAILRNLDIGCNPAYLSLMMWEGWFMPVHWSNPTPPKCIFVKLYFLEIQNTKNTIQKIVFL